MKTNHDPFLPDGQFCQLDTAFSGGTLKSWLTEEINNRPQTPARQTARIVTGADGRLELHMTVGDVTRIITGPRQDIERMARSHGATA